MRVQRKLVVNNGVLYIPLSAEHAEHIGVGADSRDVIIEDFLKKKGPFIAVYKNTGAKQ